MKRFWRIQTFSGKYVQISSIFDNQAIGEKMMHALNHSIEVNRHADQFEAEMDEKKRARILFLQMKWWPD